MKKPKGGLRGNPRAEVARLVDAGIDAANAGAHEDALASYGAALRIDPQNLDAHMNLGLVLAGLGRQQSAARHLDRALALAPEHPLVQLHAGTAFARLGRHDLAIDVLGKARTAAPYDAGVLAALGTSLVEVGRFADAVSALEQAVVLDPSHVGARMNLHRALWATKGPRAALPHAAEAMRLAPEALFPRLALALAMADTGDVAGARATLEGYGPGNYVGVAPSFEYLLAHRGKAPNFATTRETLVHGLGAARADGLVLEFGVRFGTSIRWIAEAAGGDVHGFDSFDGLPEDWNLTTSRGDYTTHGEPPVVPERVKLHVGLFDATLPGFARDHAGPVRFVNVDCDLYSSTKTIFDVLGDRMGPGTVLVFDEYLVNDGWRDDEHKAFQEAVAARGWRYEYVAFGVLNGQAAARLV